VFLYLLFLFLLNPRCEGWIGTSFSLSYPAGTLIGRGRTPDHRVVCDQWRSLEEKS
jgi:hypothetical protein